MSHEITSAMNRAWEVGKETVPQEPLKRGSGFTFQDLYNHSMDRSVGRREGGYITGKPLLIVCIEDAIPALSPWLKPYGLIRTAGAGALDTSTTIAQLITQFETRRGEGDTPQIEGVRSHPFCGAVDLKRSETGDNREPRDIGLEAARVVNEGIGGNSAGFIHSIHRRGDLHPARVVYYDATYAGLDPTIMAEGMPKGFVGSRGWMGQEIGMRDAELAARIALGPHGFGPLFTEETPLWVVGITDNDLRSVHRDQLGEELDTINSNVNRTTLGDSIGRIASDIIIASGEGR